MFEIRPEDVADRGSIRRVHEAAFDGPMEARIVDLLRERDKIAVSLVAVAQDRVVGHVLFSPVTIERAPAGVRSLGLGPMGVLPELQRQGVGSALIREGLVRCRQAGSHVVVVLGHPGYYPRFGFSRASDHGLNNEYDADDAFMALELQAGVLEGVDGLVTYAAEFGEVGT